LFRWTRERWVLGGGACLLALLTLIGIPTWAHMIQHRAAQPAAAHPATLALSLPLPPAPQDVAHVATPVWRSIEVQPGQTLSEIFQAQGLSNADLAAVMASGKDTGALKNLHPGDQVDFLTSGDDRFEGFRYEPDSATQVTLKVAADGNLAARVTALPTERRIHFAHGVVDGSLFAAGEKAGLSDAMVLKLADVFKYDIDFFKDLKPGDHFTVVYDDIYRNGKYAGAGGILAAEFVNAGHRYTAYQFKQSDGSLAYFSQDGRPLRRGLLRTPIAFARVSSHFGMRKDPVLGFTRLHKGIDYAAPAGTPVHAAGDGVITYRGKARGYGNFITIKDSPEYTTAYGHMQRFAPGLHVGSRVTQGQVIGYVGSTGWATGPNLHYEVRVNGKPENPLTMTMPKPQPLTGKTMVAFRTQTAPLVARIQMIDNATQRLARVDTQRAVTTTAD
jgi:murein DD-endopeptidase MepM/ murein hydrolase activator NlpD